MSKSIKHHYLPKFYLKGFANDGGKMAIYDCRKRCVKKGEYYLSTHFYQKNRNTIKFKESENRILEDLYSKDDNRHSKLFQFIQECEGIPALSDKQMSLLQEFVLGIFWRLPSNDEYYDEFINRNQRLTKFFEVINTESGEVNERVTQEITTSPPFLKGIKALVPYFSIMKSKKSFDFQNWRIAYHPNGFNFCSDNPIIVKDSTVKDILETDFIMPLTKYHTLFRTLEPHRIKYMEPILVAKTHCLILKQSINYCCAPKRDYLEAVSKIADNYAIDSLKKSIFDFLDNPPKVE